MSSLPPFEPLNALTHQGVLLLDTLEKLLEQEFDALNQRNIDQLQQLIVQKTDALTQLEENNIARNQLFLQADITPDKAGLQQYCGQLSETQATTFKNQWSKLEQVLHSVNDKNRRNELIISRNSRNLEQLLSILRGQNQKTMLYDQSGEKGNYSAQSRIGKA